jgi:hypothetical protein
MGRTWLPVILRALLAQSSVATDDFGFPGQTGEEILR